MKRKSFSALVALSLATLLGCASESGVDPSSEAVAPQPASDGLGLTIERAQRSIDRGLDVATSRDALTEVLATPDLSAAERQTAALALSQAHQALGDRDAAIRTVEETIARLADEREIDQRPLHRRLTWLLTGSEELGEDNVAAAPVAPFAKALLEVFPPDANGQVSARFVMAGGDDRLSEELGTYNLRGALRERKEAACPLCRHDVQVSRSIRQSSWLVIPETEARLDEAMLVVYFDLGRNRVPARYDAYLPMKSADIAAELEAGKSFALAAERPGKPPVLLMAAPRSAMLADVERHVSGLASLPLEPAYVEVASRLRPEEIQQTMRREWFTPIRACYEQLLKDDPAARGRLIASFAITGEGQVAEPSLKSEGAALERPGFLACAGEALAGVRFPRSEQRITVEYPVSFTPDQEE